MSEWQEDIFENFIKLKRGYDLPNQSIIHGEYPIIASTAVKDFHNRYKAKPPGVVTGRSGSIGAVQYICEKYWPLNTTLYVKDYKGNFPRYVYYFLLTMHLENFNSGAGVPTLNQNHLHKLRIKIPPIGTQEKITAILAAYDDLIENNKRRIALLEKMAEEIYQEWFVRMRFPGYKKSKFIKGVPADWETTKLGQIVNLIMGQSPKSEYYNESGEGLPFNQGVGTYGERFPKRITFCTVDGRKAKAGDILFSVRAPVGRLNVADCEMIIGRGLAAICHKEKFNSYLFYLLKVAFSDEDIIGNGSIFNSVGKDELKAFDILTPSKYLVIKFNEIAKNIDNKISFLFQTLNNLKKSRDMLLGRLISGKLSVESLDIQFPPSMQNEQDVDHAQLHL